MADVFISYAAEDREFAARLAIAFERHSVNVWWDRKISFGSVFHDVIERELDDARAVATLWSVHSVSSEWVRNEASSAADREVLIPVKIDDCKLPLAFRSRQTAEMTAWRGSHTDDDFLCVLTAVREKLSRPVSDLVCAFRAQYGETSSEPPLAIDSTETNEGSPIALDLDRFIKELGGVGPREARVGLTGDLTLGQLVALILAGLLLVGLYGVFR